MLFGWESTARLFVRMSLSFIISNSPARVKPRNDRFSNQTVASQFSRPDSLKWTSERTDTVFVDRGREDRLISVPPPSQGQRSLTLCAANDLCHKIKIPSATATFHGDAFSAGVLLEQR